MSKLCALVVSLFAILALSAPPALAQTQAWPQQPVRFILPFGPGAGADIGVRLIQDRLQARWGKPVVIENRPGGDSMIAIQAVLAANDDHTFLWGRAEASSSIRISTRSCPTTRPISCRWRASPAPFPASAC